MSRGVRSLLFGSTAIAALGVLAGCGHYWFGAKRGGAGEVACINSGAVGAGTRAHLRDQRPRVDFRCGCRRRRQRAAQIRRRACSRQQHSAGAMPPRWPVVQSIHPAAGRPAANARAAAASPPAAPRPSGRRYRSFRQAPPKRMRTIWATNPVRRVPMTARPPRARRHRPRRRIRRMRPHPRRAP